MDFSKMTLAELLALRPKIDHEIARREAEEGISLQTYADAFAEGGEFEIMPPEDRGDAQRAEIFGYVAVADLLAGWRRMAPASSMTSSRLSRGLADEGFIRGRRRMAGHRNPVSVVFGIRRRADR